MKRHASETKIFINILKDINFNVCELHKNFDKLINTNSPLKNQTNKFSIVGFKIYSGTLDSSTPAPSKPKVRQKQYRA
jgi:hypothetical protein